MIDAAAIAKIAHQIGPEEVEINTPLRASAVKPLSIEDIGEITAIFRGICGDKIKVRSVYEVSPCFHNIILLFAMTIV